MSEPYDPRAVRAWEEYAAEYAPSDLTERELYLHGWHAAKAARTPGPDVSRLLAAAKAVLDSRRVGRMEAYQHLLAVIAEHEADPAQAGRPRTEQCTYCWEYVTEWVDPHWWHGRLCLACESKAEHEAVTTDTIVVSTPS